MHLSKALTASFFVSFLLLSFQQLQAQSNPETTSSSGKQVRVTGRLVDSISKAPISFATVFMKNQETNMEFTINTDSVGQFGFEHMPTGDYVLKAFYVGYPQISRSLKISPSGAVMNLGNIYMQSSKTVLKEVSIVSAQDLIKQRPDGIEYLASEDPTNKGTTAAELLQKVPMLTVDMDDNLQLRGSGNVRVLIDGKPSSMIASSVSDVLKQIPSDNIKSVQVITSPGAKYDAEGSAGVVNIITKKNGIKGISGRVFTGVSYNLVDESLRGYGGAGINYRHNKFGLSANLGGGHWSHTSESEATRGNPEAPAGEHLSQTTTSDGGGDFMWGRLSADYSLDSLNTLSAGLGLRPGNWKTDNSQSTLFPAQNLNYIQTTHMESPRTNYSFNAAYNKKFKNDPNRTLDLLALYSLNDEDSKYHLGQTNLPGNDPAYQEENINTTGKKEFTIQADYTHPLKNHHQKIETGLKYISRDVSSDYNLHTKSDTTGGDWILNPNRTNRLQYTQQVAAAYGQFTSDLTQKLSLIAGLRYEFTDIKGNLRDNGGTFHSNFNNLLPSIIFSYKLRRFDRLNLSYTQRIERPSINYINPYINSSDPLNITEGNPMLSPEQSHKIELDYNTMIGKASLNVATFYSHTQNGIEAFTDIDNNGVAITSYGNYGKGNTLGLNLFGSSVFFNRWRVNLNGNLYHRTLSGSGVENSGWQYDAHFSTDVDIYKGLSVSGFGMYRGRQVTLQGTRSGWYRYSLGLKQKIFHDKGEISLAAESFLSPTQKTISDYTYGDAVYHTVSYRNARAIRIGFSYNFGKMKFNTPKTKEVKNTDLKNGSNNDQQQDGAPQMGG